MTTENAEKISRKRNFLAAPPKNPATDFQLTAFLDLDLRVSKAHSLAA
jgi:hypothetical protein